jgi:hypothetical protein
MKTTDEQISKLPKWAQDHICDLARERDTAVRALREWTDSQTESPVSIMELECIGERKGPSQLTRYIQTRRLEIRWEGIRLDIQLNNNNPQHEAGISLRWSALERGLSHVAMVPTSFQYVDLIAKENMR